MKCVIYARVSSKEQEKEGFSIPAQLKLLREYANRQSFTIAQEFTDSETAKSSGRTNFGKMLDFLKANPDVKIILVEKTDRLYRNFKDYVLLEDLNPIIHLVKENEIISEDSRSHAKFIHGVKVLLAKNYIDNLSEEVKKGMLEKAEQGQWPNKAPLGYLNNKETHLLEVDSDRAPIIIQLFELYSTGKYSLTTLHEKAKELGLKYRNSGRYCSRSNVQRILKNPIYAGSFKWKGKLYRGVHQPLISKKLFDKVQNQFNRIGKPKAKSRSFAFKGLLTCGYCGCAITAELKKGKYIYYHCTNGKGKCQQPYVREDRLAEAFSEIISRIHLDPSQAEEIRIALRDSFKTERDFRQKEIARLNREHAKIQKCLEQAYLDKIEGRITTEFWQSTYDRWVDEQNDVMDRINELSKANRNYYEQGVEFLELAQAAYPLYISKSIEEKARLLRIVLSNCSIKGVSLYPAYNKPFNLIAEGPSENLKLGDRDSNPDSTVQSRMSCRWTIAQLIQSNI